MKARVLSVVLASCLLAGAGVLLAAPALEAPVENALGENLLFNPSFEGPYSAYDPPGGHPDCIWGICGTAKTAAGWTPYWRSHNPADADHIINMPEFDEEGTAATNPDRVRTGEKSQSYYKQFSNFEAGVYQQVNVIPGETYCFSTWGHSWSGSDDGDYYTDPPPTNGNFRQRVGIDPTGGTDWQSGAISWGPLRIQPDFYEPFVVTATAEAETITAYIYSFPEWAAVHNDAYWDDAYLGQVEPVLPEGELALIAATDLPVTMAKTVNPNWLCDPNTSWEVTLDPAGTFTPTLSTDSGATGEQLTVSVDSSGLAPGEHETWLRFSSPDTAETLPAIPVRVAVLDLDKHIYLPSLIGGTPAR